MKKKFIIKRVRKTLLTQLFFPFLLLAVFSFILLKTPMDNFFNPRPLNHKSSYENFYNMDLPHVTVSVPTLKYSGLYYVVNGRVEGHYYYTLVNDFCQFYLLPAKGEESPVRQLEDFSHRGLLVKLDDIEYDTLLINMASQLNWTAKSLRAVCSPYVVSTIPYPFYLNYLFYITLYGGILIAFADILYLIVNIIKPLRAPAFRYLGLPALRKKNILKIESELSHAIPVKNKNIFLTSGFFVSTNLSNTIVLPLNMISQIYFKPAKRLITGGLFPMHYVLCVSVIGGKTYDFPKYREENINRIFTELMQSENLTCKIWDPGKMQKSTV